MGIHIIFGKSVWEVRNAIKNALIEDGWTDVVAGGNYVTVPAFAPCYKARVGIKVQGVSKDRTEVCPCLADSHAEGSNPSGAEDITDYNSDLKSGVILVSYPNEIIRLYSLAFGDNPPPIICKVVDENGNDRGLFIRGHVNYFADSGGKAYCSVSEVLYLFIPSNKVYVGNVVIKVGGTFMGMCKGLLPYGGSSLDLGIVHLIGNEKYIADGEWLVRFE